MLQVAENIQNLRPYIPGKPIEEVQKEYGLDRVVKLASNENPMGSSPIALEYLTKSLSRLNRYPDVGALDLRLKLAEYLGLDIEKIVTGSGSEGIMLVLMRAYLQRHHNVITSNGSFIGFYVLANARGVELRTTPMKNYHYDLDAIADRIDENTKMIYLANPNNPTGTIISKEELDSFMRHVPDSTMLILDEAYYEYGIDNPDYPDSIEYQRDNVVSLRTFSKAYGLAGIRIGYGFGPKEMIANLFKVKLPFEPSIPAQAAGLGALHDSEFLKQHLEYNRIGKQMLYGLFDELGLEYVPSEANFIMLPFDSEERACSLQHEMLKNGVIVRPLKAFGLPNCLRITIGMPDDNEYLADVLKKIL